MVPEAGIDGPARRPARVPVRSLHLDLVPEAGIEPARSQ